MSATKAGPVVAFSGARRRVLLSAYACSPHWGSEPGVGWRWLVELSRQHDVVLVTHGYFRAHLEPQLQQEPLPGLQVHYLAPPALGAHPHVQLNSRLFYVWWQWHLRRLVRRLLARESIDLLHHLTWGTIRFPIFLAGLGVPLMMGPLGGGEMAPMGLFEGLPWREHAFEWVRRLSLWWSRRDPWALRAPKASFLVLCKTRDTLEALPAGVREHAVIAQEIGAPPVDLRARNARPSGQRPFRLLFAARLVGWKGVLLALNAVRRLHASGYDVCLDIAGDGPMRARLDAELAGADPGARVRLLGNVPRATLLDLYGEADLLLFPSMHDSSGNVVLEALSRGLPVICLDLGGPKHYVTADCGIIVSTHDRSRTEVEAALAGAIASLFDRPERLRAMTQAAAAQAAAQTWARRVGEAYALAAQRLDWA